MKKTYTSPKIDITVISAEENIMLVSAGGMKSTDIQPVQGSVINF